MRSLTPFLCLLLASLTLSACLGAVPATDPTADILAFERAACAAFQRNDAAVIDTLLTDDITLIQGDGTISRKADLLREAREELVTYTRFENVDQVVRFYGPNTAVVIGRTIISGRTKDGAAVEVDVIFTDTVIKVRGQWKFAAGHVSRVPRRS
jgi:uncharacterized protein (TIGR02246 family)